MPSHTPTHCTPTTTQTPGQEPGLQVKTHLKAGGIIVNQ
jgi:hypothetical protein